MKTLRGIASAIGVLLLLPLLYLYVTSGLVAPGWAVLGFLAIWVALVVLAVRWFRTRAYVVMALPFAGLALWFGVLSFGDLVLGWTP